MDISHIIYHMDKKVERKLLDPTESDQVIQNIKQADEAHKRAAICRNHVDAAIDAWLKTQDLKEPCSMCHDSGTASQLVIKLVRFTGSRRPDFKNVEALGYTVVIDESRTRAIISCAAPTLDQLPGDCTLGAPKGEIEPAKCRSARLALLANQEAITRSMLIVTTSAIALKHWSIHRTIPNGVQWRYVDPIKASPQLQLRVRGLVEQHLFIFVRDYINNLCPRYDCTLQSAELINESHARVLEMILTIAYTGHQLPDIR